MKRPVVIVEYVKFTKDGSLDIGRPILHKTEVQTYKVATNAFVLLYIQHVEVPIEDHPAWVNKTFTELQAIFAKHDLDGAYLELVEPHHTTLANLLRKTGYIVLEKPQDVC